MARNEIGNVDNSESENSSDRFNLRLAELHMSFIIPNQG